MSVGEALVVIPGGSKKPESGRIEHLRGNDLHKNVAERMAMDPQQITTKAQFAMFFDTREEITKFCHSVRE